VEIITSILQLSFTNGKESQGTELTLLEKLNRQKIRTRGTIAKLDDGEAALTEDAENGSKVTTVENEEPRQRPRRLHPREK